MKINGGIRYMERGIDIAIRAMQVQTQLMAIGNENVLGFDKVGYTRQAVNGSRIHPGKATVK